MLFCEKEFKENQRKRLMKMPVNELLKEYDALCDVVNLDSCTYLIFLDEILILVDLIEERCVDLIREHMLDINNN